MRGRRRRGRGGRRRPRWRSYGAARTEPYCRRCRQSHRYAPDRRCAGGDRSRSTGCLENFNARAFFFTMIIGSLVSQPFRAPCHAMAEWRRRACFKTRRGGRREHCAPCAAARGAPAVVSALNNEIRVYACIYIEWTAPCYSGRLPCVVGFVCSRHPRLRATWVIVTAAFLAANLVEETDAASQTARVTSRKPAAVVNHQLPDRDT